jgi:septum formation protein
MGIVLASGSPRPQELMQMLGVKDLRIIPARGEEKFTPGTPPEEIVKELSRAKAEEVAAQCLPADIIIAADTIVWVDGGVFGKPKSREEAAFMLRRLSGRGHTVYTGVTILSGGACDSEVERTEVYFRELGDREIEAYIASGEPMDKAGAYGAQGLASLFVRGIDGDFFNVMGLPVCRLGGMLKKQGVELI